MRSRRVRATAAISALVGGGGAVYATGGTGAGSNVTVVPFTPNIVTVPNVEIIEVGEDWETSTGVFTWTEEDLVSAIESQDDPAVRVPILKLGHADPRPGFGGDPALGRLQNMRLANNNQTLICDLVGVPQWLAAIMWSAYPRRSFEGEVNVTTRTGNTWPLVVTALSLLGAAYPAINTLEDLQALWGNTPPILYGPDGQPVEASGDDVKVWRRKVAAGATSFGDLPLDDRDTAWSKSAADTGVREWASSDGSGDLDKIDWSKYREAFFWYDADNTEAVGSYKLMFATVKDGTLTAVPRGIFGCAAVLQGSRGGVDIPASDEAGVKAVVAKYYAKMAEEFDDDTITPPWEANASMARNKRKVSASVGLDDVRMAYYDSLDSAQMWWWVRQVLINPLQLVVDDDEGGLYTVDVTVNSSDDITFGDPSPVKIEYVAATQLVAASYPTASDAGARKRPASAVAANSSGTESEATPEEEEHNNMDLTPEALEALGLAADASPADISAAIIARGQQAPSNEPPTGTIPSVPPAVSDAPTDPPTVSIPEGMELVDSTTVSELRELVNAGRAAREQQATRDRDALFADAVKAGKFPRSRIEHYQVMFEADPEGTKELITKMSPGVIPITERGNAGETDPKTVAAAYPDTWKHAVATSTRLNSARVKVGND